MIQRFIHILLAGIFLAACGTAKQATVKGLSAADYPYIEKFHEGVRLKARGQTLEAIKAFEFCYALNPKDDAVAFALAQCHLVLNERPKAAEYTEIAADIDPKNIWYTQELAYMYFEQGRFEDARKCFEKMVAKEPKNIDWLFGYAEILKRLGKKQEAVDAFNKMEDQLGVLPDISIQKYDLYMLMKQEDKALNELVEAKKSFPDDISVLGTLVDYYFQKHDVQKARDMLIALVVANPTNGRANLALADLYMRENNKKEAYPYFKGAFLGEGVDVDAKMNVLLTFYEQQIVMDPEVLELAGIMILQHPEDAKSYSIQGDLLLKNNENEKALEAYRQALKLDETKFAIWNQVLMLEYRQRQFDNLYKDSRMCSALFPTVSSVQLLYAIACVQTGRYTEAIDAADNGKDIVVDDKVTEAEFYAQKAEAQFWLKLVDAGIENFEQALVLDPSNHLTKNNYAMLLAVNNRNLSHAHELIDQIVYQYPNEAPFIDTKGVVLFHEGKYEDAKLSFEDAFEKSPTDKNYAEHMGDVYVKLGSPDKAIEFWKLAKSLGSKNQVLDKKIQTKSYYAPVY